MAATWCCTAGSELQLRQPIRPIFWDHDPRQRRQQRAAIENGKTFDDDAHVDRMDLQHWLDVYPQCPGTHRPQIPTYPGRAVPILWHIWASLRPDAVDAGGGADGVAAAVDDDDGGVVVAAAVAGQHDGLLRPIHWDLSRDYFAGDSTEPG